MSPTIEIVVTPDGQTQITTAGFFGPRCQEATRALETALGARVSETLTSEYYQQQELPLAAGQLGLSA